MDQYLSVVGFVIAGLTFAAGIGAVINALRISGPRHQRRSGA
jgi:hypothetical protein